MHHVFQYEPYDNKTTNNSSAIKTIATTSPPFIISLDVYAKEINSIHNLIFIYEFQDYSYAELAMYKRIFPEAIFNYYGDFNQCINTKGMPSRDLLEHVDNTWGCFEILENYRNAYEITQYVNNKFKMNMVPIGIKGAVSFLAFSLDSLSITSVDDRIACIIKDGNSIIDKFKMDERFNMIVDSESEILRGKINIFPVSFVKGLEFERVYVIAENMTQNEEYVAYTRALNELIIIDY